MRRAYRVRAVLLMSALAALAVGAPLVVAQAEGSGTAASGNERVDRNLTLSGGMAKAMPPGAKVGGGGLTITNTGATDDRLLAVESTAAGRVELHEMTMDNDVMRMRKIDGVDIPAGRTVTLSGDKHLMFLDIPTPFKSGDVIPLTLIFEKAGAVSYTLLVGSAAGK